MKKVPLMEENINSLTSNSFDTTAKQRLLSSVEDVGEPKNIDSTLLDISESRDNRSKGIYDGNKDQDSDKVQKVTPIVKKSLHQGLS